MVWQLCYTIHDNTNCNNIYKRISFCYPFCNRAQNKFCGRICNKPAYVARCWIDSNIQIRKKHQDKILYHEICLSAVQY